MKEQFAKLEISKLPQLISEVKHRIDIINQKEAIETAEDTKMLINEAMKDITFSFAKIGQEEMKLISGGDELKDKYRQVINLFTNNIDDSDPELMPFKEAFMMRCKEHGFVIDSVAKFNEETKAMDEILERLQDIQRRNNALMKKYNGDEKFVRVHKRISEENKKRVEKNQRPMFSLLDHEIMVILKMIKEDVDNKVYDRNNILKQDAYFKKTVLTVISNCLHSIVNIDPQMDDYEFICSRISQQYINQYNAIYN